MPKIGDPSKTNNSFQDSTSNHYDNIPLGSTLNRKKQLAHLETSSSEQNGVDYKYAFLTGKDSQDPILYFKNLNKHEHCNIGQVFFDSGKATISESKLPELQKFAAQANEYFKNNSKGTLTINAYTDRDGSVEYNKKLSEKRAEFVGEYLANFIDEKFRHRVNIVSSANGEQVANQVETKSSDRMADISFSAPTTQRYGVLVLTSESRQIKGALTIDMGRGNTHEKHEDKGYDPKAPEGSVAVIVPYGFVRADGPPLKMNVQVENPNNIRFLIANENCDRFSFEPVNGQKNTFNIIVAGKEVAQVNFDLVGSSKDKEVKLADIQFGGINNNGKVEILKEKDLYHDILKQSHSTEQSDLIKNTGYIVQNREASLSI
jgi:outer membrane protein OmpA-like peptidoglycan-associated protein